MKAAGICMGASNIKIAEVEKNNNEINIINLFDQTHEGNVKETLKKLFYGKNLSSKNMAVTGRKFKSLVNVPSISEAEATEIALDTVKDKYEEVEAIVSAGGETFMVYELSDQGKIINVFTGNKCASGTGEFFLQQIKRMNLNINKAMELAQIENPYRVSGRCSVFCKSDCTHALNKGEDKGRIVAGLCEMMVHKIMELLNKCGARKIMLVGGTSKNSVMVNFLKERLEKVVVPDEACHFEALGASIWSLENGKKLGEKNLFNKEERSFEFLPPLEDYRDMVTFHEMDTAEAEDGDRCILGLDVGSTTTKAVVIREKDDALLASEYLRTSGDPVAASRECYQSLHSQLKDKDLKIVGLGVTGSGRKITGLHALTNSVVNEIIAHANGAVYFDEEVDTIFEIGGQDAKYTYIVNKVPTDYAMNEACSAGTGSFLEEAAEESLNIEMEDIADIALKGQNPPNFSDQCAAFISSDIKNAIQENISIEDISAGLVYSICLNYTNRVKGNRPVGEKVFMQGGVCYNQAVPMAMAALTGKEIVVPPEPGLMGAFGVALVVKQQLDLGLVEEKEFDLKELMNREVEYCEPFICSGGKENCDRKCKINVLKIEGEKYPFGGICNKYMNMNQNEDYDIEELDLVRYREKLVNNKYFIQPQKENTRGKIGINKSLTVNTLLPLFSSFFAELGYEIVLPDKIREAGIQKQSAAFCYPVEISHGYMYDLLQKDTDYIFLPHIKGLYVENGAETSVLCPMAQAEPYYLSATWKELENDRVFSPVLDFKDGYEEVEDKFIEVADNLGISSREAAAAFKKAVKNQKDFKSELKETGKKVLKELEKKEDKKAVVVFGRPYNALTSEANMGIPHKLASRGEQVIPFDMLPLAEEEVSSKMYWSMGQLIMKGAKFVSNHPQLFGLYVTNFSCGPDSFLVSYFRKENGRKPSLTLELDSHTADAGLNTRIEAFLDVVDSYRKLQKRGYEPSPTSSFKMARIEGTGDNLTIMDSKGNPHSLADEEVKVLVPSMGGLTTRAFVLALRYSGVEAEACPAPGEEELKLGRANSTGKECLPLQLTMGSLLKYINNHSREEEVLVYFMPEASGPCRFGQYNVLMKQVIQENKIPNVALLSLTSTNGYAGLGKDFTKRAWQSIVTADVLDDINSSILALAENKEKALEQFNKSKQKIFNALENKSWGRIKKLLANEAQKLSRIKLKIPYEEAKKVALTGEIYVRSDKFSRQFLVEKLAEKNIVTKVAPTNEWIYYVDYLVQNSLITSEPSFMEKMKNKMERIYKRKMEKDVKSNLSQSGLCDYNLTEIPEIVEATENLMSEELTGETVLTIGGTITEIIEDVDGVIAIGPFGCMPHRVSQSIITDKLEEVKKNIAEKSSISEKILDKFSSLPFLAIETDGNPFPQVIEARIEAFCLQVRRINDYINDSYEDSYEQVK